MKPIVKYRGGKGAEIKHFQHHIPPKFNTYIEPFFGGGALFFHLRHRPAIINDINERLIDFYRDLKHRYPLMREQLDRLQQIYEQNQREYETNKAQAAPDERVENKNEELYYQFRHYFNYPSSQWLDSVVYYFINKTAYSGMIRYNRSGEYNVPFGRYKYFNTKLITERHHQILQETKICNEDYAKIFKLAKPDDFMFLDPPYDTVFNDYGNLQFAHGFNEAEHRRLAEAFRQLPCKALMIISKTALTFELYQDCVAEEYDKAYAVNIRNRFKNEVKHLIVKNY